MEFVKITELEDFRGLLCEIRDLSIGGAMYAANISSNKIDGPFNLAMYNVISKNANIALRLFDIIEFMPEVEQKIKLEYKAVEA
jgi:hypothetical protein